MKDNEQQKQNHIQVAIITTSGSWPEKDYNTVPINQPIKVELERATRELHLADTTGWVAKIDTRQLEPDRSYQDNGLSDKVDINYGPIKGGGGHA